MLRGFGRRSHCAPGLMFALARVRAKATMFYGACALRSGFERGMRYSHCNWRPQMWESFLWRAAPFGFTQGIRYYNGIGEVRADAKRFYSGVWSRIFLLSVFFFFPCWYFSIFFRWRFSLQVLISGVYLRVFFLWCFSARVFFSGVFPLLVFFSGAFLRWIALAYFSLAFYL